MPMFERSFAGAIYREVKVFLSLRIGATRGGAPLYEDAPTGASAPETRRLAAKNRELSDLRARVAKAEKAGALKEAPAEEPPFFLVGRGRSGTTWLMNALNAHPEVLCRGEGYLLNRNFRREDFKEVHPRLKTSTLHNAIAESEASRLWVERSVWTEGDDPEEHLDDLTRIAVRYFLNRRRDKFKKKIVGDKTPFTSTEWLSETIPEVGSSKGRVHFNGVELLDDIARIFPDGKAIHLLRDGRDNAVSVMHFLWSRARGREGGLYTLDPEDLRKRDLYWKDPSAALAEGIFTEKRIADIARVWNSQVGEAIERGPKILGGNYFEARYEDLLRRPEEEMGRIFDFLGADASEGTVKECVEATSFQLTSGREQGEEESSSVKFRKGVAGDWKNVFTERDKEIFKREAGDLLVKLGYEEDGGW